MTTRTQRTMFFITMVLIGGGLLLATTMAQPRALAQEQADAAVKVGTYEPQRLFEGYHGRQKFVQDMTGLEQRMQQAQQTQNQEQMMQVQQDAERLRDAFLQKFQQELTAAMPEVARAKGVQLVAMQIVYVADDIQREDLTQPLLEKINANAEN